MEQFVNGRSLREIERDFAARFKSRVSRSALHRWAGVVGETLAREFRFQRALARKIVAESGARDALEAAFGDFEDRLLAASAELAAKEPRAVLQAVLERRKIAQRERELQLRERELELRARAADPHRILTALLATLGDHLGRDAAALAWWESNCAAVERDLSAALHDATTPH